ncbi:MAG: Uma2 family endonuclease [Pseudonocardiaceae bacterium]
MTALPQPPGHLLTVAEYAELGESTSGSSELQEGNIIMSPSSTPRHMIASGRLLQQVQSQLPGHLCAIQEVDVDLTLVPPDQPGLVRRPDLVVVDDKAVDRVDRDGGLLRADDVLVVVEIVSAGTRRLDHVVKRGEYGDAGIEHYWIIDLDKPVTLLDCHLAGPLGYVDGGSLTGTFATTAPCPIRLELDLLLR